MKSYLLFLLAFLGLLPAVSGQRPPDLDRITDSIVAEGKRLYASERTSWDGTDLFVAKFADRQKLGGYFSYPDGDSFRCVFYSRDVSPRVLGSVSFDSAHDAGKARVDLTERDFTPLEQPIYRIRAKDFVSAWDCEKEGMVILTMEAAQRIMKDVEKRSGRH